MKKVFLLVMICIAFTSCSNDNTSTDARLANKKIESFDFPSNEKMEEKIDEISLIKEKMEESIAKKYIAKNIKSNNNESSILNELTKYHKEKLQNIYNLRKNLNFTSIQSIADEINSLKLLNPKIAEELFQKHEKYLIESEYGITTIFENRIANVVNEKGEVLINGQIIDIKNSDSKRLTGRYVYDEGVRTDRATISNDMRFVILFSAGREKHKDTFGKVFFRYFTEFQAYYTDPVTGTIQCPTTFSVSSNSIAGFSQSGSNPFADFALTVPYPSGNGSVLRNTSGQIWTSYQTEGGYIKGTFTGAGYTLNCDYKYTK